MYVDSVYACVTQDSPELLHFVKGEFQFNVVVHFGICSTSKLRFLLAFREFNWHSGSAIGGRKLMVTAPWHPGHTPWVGEMAYWEMDTRWIVLFF